jgi:hypothetical protein
MKISIEPEVYVWFIRIIFLNVCIGAMGTMVLVLASLFLPPTLVDTWIAYVGVIVGCLMSLSVYRVWGSASCLADINVWCMALLAALGSEAIHSMICSMLPDRDSAGLVANALKSCAPNNSRANAIGGALAVFGATFIVWVAVRYLSWAKGRR